jgi:hypothetical protein
MTATVTPIRSGDTQPPGQGPKPPKRPRKPRSDVLKLRGRDGNEGFTTLDLINGLRGVCRALDDVCVNHGGIEADFAADLAMAARALSEIIGNRVGE